MEEDTGQRTLHSSIVESMRCLVSKPDLYLIRAAQASTLKQLKGARTALRNFNAAAKQQLEEKIAASEAAVQHLNSIRHDLDEAYACIRALKRQLAEQHPELYQQVMLELATAND